MVVYINLQSFEYDVLALLNSFFMSKKIVILTDSSLESKKVEFQDQVTHRIRIEDDSTKVEYQGSHFESWKGMHSFATTKEYKYYFKRQYYRYFANITGKTLEWGSITGIRPTKIALQVLEKAKSSEYFDPVSELEEEYLLSNRKANLLVEVASLENKLFQTVDLSQGYSLYIGIPFCPTTCLYCSFTSYPIHRYESMVEQYLDALILEMQYVASAFKDKRLTTVYIGGGTPTTLNPNQLERLLGALKDCFDWGNVLEFCVEAGRADSITRDKLVVLKRYGVERISVNPQTMNDQTLKLIGRNHTSEQAIEAFQLAREVGFSNINMDIILGLPGEGIKEVEKTLREIEKLHPDSLTIHSLALKRASAMVDWMEKQNYQIVKDLQDEMDLGIEAAKRMNLNPYYLYRQKNMAGNLENIGFAKEGCYGFYNCIIMEELQTVIALGAGAVSKFVFGDGRIERCDNIKDVTLYTNQILDMIQRKKLLVEKL